MEVNVMDYLEWRRLQNDELDPDNVSLHAALGVIDSITDDQWLSSDHIELRELAFSFVSEDDDATGVILDAYLARFQDFYQRHPGQRIFDPGAMPSDFAKLSD
jgi:hypothetical protein